MITISSGPLSGAVPNSDGVRAYKGIPYAAPPVGKLRWKAPQAVSPWKDPRPFDRFGWNAPQRVLFDDIDPLIPGTSEDCLYLNVWTPVEPHSNERLPVLFYIHGGGFAVGSGAEPRYDGSRLAARGIVVVTVNYRLNALGLLAHPALTADAETNSSGNFAMLDLVAALNWVNQSIIAFGGSPDAVTIAGESAGSMFVSMLMASPLARGLFHGAIGESGAQFPSGERPMLSLKEAEAQGIAFAKKLGAKTAEELRAVPVEAILDANPGLGFWPIVDGHFLPEKPVDIFAKGKQADVPLLAGWNKDEGFNFDAMNWPPAKDGYEHLLATLFKDKAAAVLKLYPGGKAAKQSARDLGGDLVINHGTWAWLEAQRNTVSADVFRYRFDRAPKTPKGWFKANATAGAFHSCEIPYVLENLDAFSWLVNEDDHKLARLCADYWVNFTKTGNPNGPGLPHWPSYREELRPTQILNVASSVEFDPDRDRHQLLARLLA